MHISSYARKLSARACTPTVMRMRVIAAFGALLVLKARSLLATRVPGGTGEQNHDVLLATFKINVPEPVLTRKRPL